MSAIVRLMREEMGASAVEYGLIAALVSVTAILGMSALGVSLSDMFTLLTETVKEITETIESG